MQFPDIFKKERAGGLLLPAQHINGSRAFRRNNGFLRVLSVRALRRGLRGILRRLARSAAAVAAAAVRAERFVRSRFPVSGSCACVPDFADFQAGRRIFPGKSLFLPPELPCTVRPSGNDDHFITLSR